MRGVALPESPAEAPHVTGRAFDVLETGIPAKRPVSKHPELVSLRISHLCALLRGRKSGNTSEPLHVLLSSFLLLPSSFSLSYLISYNIEVPK